MVKPSINHDKQKKNNNTSMTLTKKPPRKEKTYNSENIRAAVIEVCNGSTIYKAAKKFSMPWSTLKAYYSRYHHDPTSSSQLKRGKPFVLPSEIEIKLLSYINKMQEIGFGLTVKQIRIVAYHPFQHDVKLKNGREWIECQFCKTWYHVTCQNVINPVFFLCSNCEISD